MNDATSYHAVFAVGHFARCLQARTHGRRGSFHALAVLGMLWLRTDPLADAPVVSVSLDDFAGVVSSAERLRQVIAELVTVGAVERVDNVLTRSVRLIKPGIEDLDATAHVRMADAVAQAEHARVDLAQAQRLSGIDATPAQSSTNTTKNERDAVLTRMGKRPSDVRDVLASMVGVSPASLRYSGAGSGAVQAAVGWLAETSATWEGLTMLCEHVRTDADRPKRELVWLFGEQHRAYRDGVVALLREQHPSAKSTTSAEADATAQGEVAQPRVKKLGEMARVDVERWLKHQVKDERATAEVWGSEAAVAALLRLTGPEATQRIQAWQADPSYSLEEHFA